MNLELSWSPRDLGPFGWLPRFPRLLRRPRAWQLKDGPIGGIQAGVRMDCKFCVTKKSTETSSSHVPNKTRSRQKSEQTKPSSDTNPANDRLLEKCPARRIARLIPSPASHLVLRRSTRFPPVQENRHRGISRRAFPLTVRRAGFCQWDSEWKGQSSNQSSPRRAGHHRGDYVPSWQVRLIN